MTIRLLKKTDIAVIVNGFKESGWQIKPASVFEQYLDEQEQDKRICWVAFVDEKFAGYVTPSEKNNAHCNNNYVFYAKESVTTHFTTLSIVDVS